ncbi:MAG: hypothetical protein JO202_08100 [Ktedonobacteraceae bacterium]|nr:hypothetical protein [Ktedonobacteraceae bacterium]
MTYFADEASLKTYAPHPAHRVVSIATRASVKFTDSCAFFV